MDPRVASYLRLFSHQSGGELPVFYVRERNQVGQGFRFERNQVGHGFLDWLKKAGRAILPVFLRGASGFLSNFADKQSQGLSLKDAAKSASAPLTILTLSSNFVSFKSIYVFGKPLILNSIGF